MKQKTALELLEELLEGNSSNTLIVSRFAILAVIKQLRKEQNLTCESYELSDRSRAV